MQESNALELVHNGVASFPSNNIGMPSPVNYGYADSDKYFLWSDAETKLLLQAITKYKQEKANQGLNWHSVKSKWFDIRHVFLELYPDASDAHLDEYPNAVDVEVKFSKERVKRKAHKLRLMYKAAVEKGSKRGGGKLFPMLFDSMEHLWRDEVTLTNVVSMSEVSSEADEDVLLAKLEEDGEDNSYPSISDINMANNSILSSSSSVKKISGERLYLLSTYDDHLNYL